MRLLPFSVVKVIGHSMEPTLKEGSFLLVGWWAFRFRDPQIGQIVVLQNPQEPGQYLCKRIGGFEVRTNRYAVRGDNQHDSLDSLKFGPIKKSQILGRVYPLQKNH